MILRCTRLATVFVAIMLFASSALASDQYWLSEPEYCDADDGKIEDDDIIYLTSTGIDSHFFSCSWPSEVGDALLKDKQWVNIRAKCSNATTSWEAEFEIVQQSDGSVRVFQESGGITPVRFYRCEP